MIGAMVRIDGENVINQRKTAVRPSKGKSDKLDASKTRDNPSNCVQQRVRVKITKL